MAQSAYDVWVQAGQSYTGPDPFQAAVSFAGIQARQLRHRDLPAAIICAYGIGLTAQQACKFKAFMEGVKANV